MCLNKKLELGLDAGLRPKHFDIKARPLHQHLTLATFVDVDDKIKELIV